MAIARRITDMITVTAMRTPELILNIIDGNRRFDLAMEDGVIINCLRIEILRLLLR